MPSGGWVGNGFKMQVLEASVHAISQSFPIPSLSLELKVIKQRLFCHSFCFVLLLLWLKLLYLTSQHLFLIVGKVDTFLIWTQLLWLKEVPPIPPLVNTQKLWTQCFHNIEFTNKEQQCKEREGHVLSVYALLCFFWIFWIANAFKWFQIQKI